MNHWKWILSIPLISLAAGACGTEKTDENEGECEVGAAESGCEAGMVCEETVDGEPKCAAPIEIRGQVVDTATSAEIEGAWVQATDPNGAAVGTSAVTDVSGMYVLQVPAVRDAAGEPVETAYTLRAQASGYQRFPFGLRQALPLDASSAEHSGEDVWVIENALSTIGLIRLPDSAAAESTISGTVVAESCAGILVVAESNGVGLPGYSDSDCTYTIFNVPAGSYTVRGYAVDLQLSAADATVADGESVSGVDLVASSTEAGLVSGSVQIVNAPGGSVTSVILAVKSTFIESAGKGEAPPGLRVGDVTGDFSIDGVPDGSYVVLAAFENDNLVRDPDESIGGTELIELEIPDADGNRSIVLPGFKVTEALGVVQPGADTPEEITDLNPTFEWADDSSEEGYTISVLDAFGEELFADEIESVSGSDTVTYVYEGPAFEAGMYYQFRAVSFRGKDLADRTFISATEDLRGVFYYMP